MKSSLKNIVLCLTSTRTVEYEIDADMFQDPFFEALTRAVEQDRKNPIFKMRPSVACWEKTTPSKSHTYNAYLAMINAGMHTKANLFREKCKAQYDIDLAKEPLHG